MKREWVDGREERGGRRGRKGRGGKKNPQRLNEICDKIKKRETQKYTQEERSVMRIGLLVKKGECVSLIITCRRPKQGPNT